MKELILFILILLLTAVSAPMVMAIDKSGNPVWLNVGISCLLSMAVVFYFDHRLLMYKAKQILEKEQ